MLLLVLVLHRECAAVCPLSTGGMGAIAKVKTEDLRGVSKADFLEAMKNVRPAVPQTSLRGYEEWAKLYGRVGV